MNKIFLLVCLVAILLVSGNLIVNNLKQNKVMAFAHRGFSGKYTENSLQAFDQAIKLGVDGIELDVWLCKTGELVVMHDATIDRLTSGHGKLVDLSFADLRQLKLPNGEQIPTLNEVLKLVNNRCIVNIELKGPNTAVPVAQLITDFLQQGWHINNFLVTSFDHIELAKFHEIIPQIPFGPLTDGVMLGYAKFAKDMQANYLVINYEYATPALIKDAHARDLKLLVYTVNDLPEIKKMKALGVSGIISNFPNLVL